jgi:hypothetical protein
MKRFDPCGARRLARAALVVLLAAPAVAAPAAVPKPSRIAAAKAPPAAGHVPKDLRDGLVLYYPFEEKTGDTTADASGSGHTGTLKGAVRVPGGARGAAMRFQGQSEITAPHSDQLAFAASNSFTVALWAFREKGSGGWDGVLAVSRLKAPFYGLYVEPGGKWVVYTGPLTGPKAEPRWTHVALIQDGVAGKRRLYIDGASVAECPAQDGNGPGILAVGSGGCGFAWFQGLLDEVCIYSRALKAEELRALMTATGPADPK